MLKKRGLSVACIALLGLLGFAQAAHAIGYGRSTTGYINTSGSTSIVNGNIYANPDNLTFQLVVWGDPNPTYAILHYAKVDGNGTWYGNQDVNIPLSFTYSPWPGGTASGNVPLSNLTPGQRYEFVVECGGGSSGTIWEKPSFYSSYGSSITYDLGPDYDRSESMGGFFNGFFTPVETPYAIVDFPTENATIGSTYTIRLGSNVASTNNMRVKIDTGDWSQCYFSAGYWWFDWSGYSPGTHTIVAEGWNVLGQRTESSIRNCTSN